MAASSDGIQRDTHTVIMPALRPEAGMMIGEFTLLRHLGMGGMADVWLAEQQSLKRNVALKLLKPELMSDPVYVKRFQAEAKAAGGLSHPNIVQVYSVGESDGRHYIAQEYVQGSTLKSFLQKRGALDITTGLHIMRQVASALQAASERGIVHRDIKPENIMLTRKGEVKVADFGLATLMGGERLNLTQEGTTMGTPLYMSPEQVNGQKLDQRSDLYSFGVTAYHMYAGETPFRGESAIAVAMQHLQNTPRDLTSRRPDLPKLICDIIHRMLAKKPDDRFPDAGKVLVELKKVARSLKQDGQDDELELKAFDPIGPNPGLALKHPWLVLSLLCLLTGAASASIGWMQRPRVPAESHGPAIQPEATAEAQLHRALMLINDPEQYRLVETHFTAPEDARYRQLAAEQLTLLALQGVSSPERQTEIKAQIEHLASYQKDNKNAAVKATIAQAYLEAFRNTPPTAFDLSAAKVTLSRMQLDSPGAIEREGLRETWRQHLIDVLQLINPNQNPFNDGQGPGFTQPGRPPFGPGQGPPPGVGRGGFGPRGDGPPGEGGPGEGPRPDGPRPDGPRGNGSRGPGPRGEGFRFEGRDGNRPESPAGTQSPAASPPPEQAPPSSPEPK